MFMMRTKENRGEIDTFQTAQISKNLDQRKKFYISHSNITSDASKMQTASPNKFSSDSNSCEFPKRPIKVTGKQLSKSNDIDINLSSSEQLDSPTPKVINKTKIGNESISESFNSNSIDSYFQEESKNNLQYSRQSKNLQFF
jgi:hypothetical protein